MSVLTRPGSSAGEYRAFVRIWNTWKRPPRKYEMGPPSFLPSGDHASVRNLCFPVGRSGYPGISRKSHTLHLTGLGTTEGFGSTRISRFNVGNVMPSLHLWSGQQAGEDLGRHDVAYVTDPFTLKRPILFSRVKVHLRFLFAHQFPLACVF